MDYQIQYTPNLPTILKELKLSVLITTYQAGKLITISSQEDYINQIPISFKKPMGIALQNSKVAIASIDEIHFFSNEEQDLFITKEEFKGYDSVYLQRATYHTGILDIHDLAFGDGLLWGINTLYSCIAVYDVNFSFRPKWKPPFITTITPEDKCHLNGMVMKDNLPKYVTALSTDDTENGWRTDKMKTGVLMEVPTGEIILSNLAMPHSPRFYNEKLFVLESGSGKLLLVDTENKRAEVYYNFDCFVRGLSFQNNIAILGKSKIRQTSKDFNDLSVKDNSKYAGIIFFDMESKTVIAELDYLTDVEEIFDVRLMNNCSNPVFVTKDHEIFKNITTFPGNSFWIKPKVENDRQS
jgi:uncharacterized protein (TIGR03032 family)